MMPRPDLSSPVVPAPATKRIDLHCHSDASNKAAEAALNAIRSAECYMETEQVYAQAKHGVMDVVKITDPNTIDAVHKLASRANVLLGEELTCWFPEYNCKMHLL